MSCATHRLDGGVAIHVVIVNSSGEKIDSFPPDTGTAEK
jgi:hypothetical protein